jgi:hypothetical protein
MKSERADNWYFELSTRDEEQREQREESTEASPCLAFISWCGSLLCFYAMTIKTWTPVNASSSYKLPIVCP